LKVLSIHRQIQDINTKNIPCRPQSG
jgi:hypothetical protein